MQPRPLADVLGTLPSGRVATLSPDRVAAHLRTFIKSDEQAARRAAMRVRIDLYRNRAKQHVAAIFDRVFSNSKVREARTKFIDYAQHNNVVRRVIREISTVYADKAARAFDSPQPAFTELERMMAFDRHMRLANRMLNLCNEIVLWPRLNMVTGDPELRVLTPDAFFAIPHPSDPLQLAALVIDQVSLAPTNETAPYWLVVTPYEYFNLDKSARVVDGSYRVHNAGRWPMQLVHREIPTDALLDADSGNDLIAAHLAVAFLNTLILKHQKSGTKQPYAVGDLSTTATGQPVDDEVLQIFGEGVSLNTLDLVADSGAYIAATRAIIKSVAANYGIPESVYDLSYQASSGFEIELKRSGLREIRNDQLLDWRAIEADLVSLLADVLRSARHPLAFDATGSRVNFGEMEPPTDPLSRLTYWEKARQMGLMSTVEMYMQLNPEVTAEDAAAALVSIAQVESARVQLFRSLNASPDASIEDPGKSPQQNGAANDNATANDQPSETLQ